jgi:hypothetical protein
VWTGRRRAILGKGSRCSVLWPNSASVRCASGLEFSPMQFPNAFLLLPPFRQGLVGFRLADAGESGGGWQIARTGRVALQRELRQEIIRARTDSERSMELDDAAKLTAPKAAGASAGAIGASFSLSFISFLVRHTRAWLSAHPLRVFAWVHAQSTFPSEHIRHTPRSDNSPPVGVHAVVSHALGRVSRQRSRPK